MKKIIISDLTNTLIKEESFFNESLNEVSEKFFEKKIELKLEMGEYGNPFPVHIRTILENKKISEHPLVINKIKKHCSTQKLANYLIDNYIRKFLKKSFNNKKAKPIKGLKNFIEYIEKNNITLGIVTGDLKVVAEFLITKNNFKNLNKTYKAITYGDDKISKNRENQINSTFNKLNCKKNNYFIFIDDANNGIKAMKNFCINKKLKNYIIIGVLTGASKKKDLIKSGCNLVLNNIGEVIKNIDRLPNLE